MITHLMYRLKLAIVTMSGHERRTSNPIHRLRDQQTTTGASIAEQHRISQSDGAWARAANHECCSTSTNRSSPAEKMGQGESAKEEIEAAAWVIFASAAPTYSPELLSPFPLLFATQSFHWLYGGRSPRWNEAGNRGC